MDDTQNKDRDLDLDNDPELKQILDEIAARAEEEAAGREMPAGNGSQQARSLTRTAALVSIVSGFIDRLAQEKCNTAEARFVADLIRIAVYRWHWSTPHRQETKRDGR